MERILNAVRTETLKNSSITFTSTLINGALGILFFLVAARFLGPISYGLLIVSITVNTLLTDVSDLGTDTGLVKFVSKYLKKDKTKAYQFLKLAFFIKLFVGIFVAVIGVLLSESIAVFVFSKPELTLPLKVASLGVLGAHLFDYSTHSLQAFKKFYSWGGLFIGTNLIRLLLILLFVYIGNISTVNTLVIYILMPILGFLISMFILPITFLRSKVTKSTRDDFFHYNKWVAVISLVSALAARVDVFISARFLTLEQVGIYAIANQLVQVFPQLASSLGTVFAPKMASIENSRDLVSYLKKSQLLVSAIVVAGFIVLPSAFFFFPLLLGASYVSSIPVFVTLFISMMIFLLSIPVHNAIFYYYSNPKLFSYLSVLNLFIVSISSVIFINQFGTIGLALAVLLGNTINFEIPLIWLFKKLKEK